MALPGRSQGGPERVVSGSVPYRVGERVRHARFGLGEVVETGDGKVVVRFGAQERVFVPEIAPLSKV
jgi:DNA helicase-2/ATP-dependent DNA helicase PcrA